MMQTLSSLALEIVVTTTTGANNDDKVLMVTLSLQSLKLIEAEWRIYASII